MLARELVQLAALVADRGSVLVVAPGEIDPRRLGQYWSASKCRLERWNRALKTLKFVTATSAGHTPSHLELAPTLIEILTSEALTRTWTAVLCAVDRRRGAHEAEPVARSIYVGHLEARNRALQLLLDGRGLTLSQAVRVDRLRRQAERWGDQLVARLVEFADVSEFAAHPARAQELAASAVGGPAPPPGKSFWPAVVAAVTAGARAIPADASPNGDLNAEIATAIIGCFSPELFDGAGVLASLRWAQLSAATDDAQGMIQSLLRDPPEEAAREPLPVPLPQRRKRRFL